ncbi:MAG: nucleoside triphosphate pyrophosphohydrolase, partial [Pseudomonadota bacterium]
PRSIVPYTIEETYEVVDAIERDDADDLREELGDLLLQVVYYAQMASEAGDFTFGDVVEGITAKMIRRHPHVFGDEIARSSGMAEGTWKRIKAQEKVDRAARRAELGLPPKNADSGLLDDVPATLPPLAQAVKLQDRAARVGFDWNDPRAVLAKAREELDELEAELDGQDADAEMAEFGDVLFALANYARHRGFDPERAVALTNAKMRSRFGDMERQAHAASRKLEDYDLDGLEALWTAAKAQDQA